MVDKRKIKKIVKKIVKHNIIEPSFPHPSYPLYYFTIYSHIIIYITKNNEVNTRKITSFIYNFQNYGKLTFNFGKK